MKDSANSHVTFSHLTYPNKAKAQNKNKAAESKVLITIDLYPHLKAIWNEFPVMPF